MRGRTQPGFRRRLQHGFTLLEVLMAVGLGSIVLASGSKFVNERVDDVKDQATAQYQKKFATAAERFVNDNLTAIASTLTVNGPPSAINLATIRSAGYLNSGLVATNPYRQTPCLVVRRVNDSSSGTPRLEALVTTEGGISIPEVRVPFVAAQGGAYGGFVPANAPTTAQGAYGVWSTPLAAYNSVSCSGVSVAQNHLAYALFFDGVGGAVNTDELLHRNVVAGRPDLNTMNTALNMGGFDVVNAANISASQNITAGGVLMSTNNPSAGFGQTELHRFGLSNQTGDIMVLSQAGKNVYLSDWWSKTGKLVAQFGRYELLYGHTQFSRTQQTECCNADPGTIGLAESTSGTGRKASITFHNLGVSEGTMELANDSSARRIRVYGSQGQEVGLQADNLRSGSFTSTNGETYTGGWFRTTGGGGWYSEPYGGGWYMSDPNWVRSYNNKSVVTGGEVQAGTLTSYYNVNVGSDIWMNSYKTIYNSGRQYINAGEHLFLQPWSGGITYVGGGGGSGYLNIQGNAETNDMYIRAAGIWASQLRGGVSLGTNGYKVIDPSGLAIQWGYTTNHGEWQTQALNYCFPNATIFVTAHIAGRPFKGADGHNNMGWWDRCQFSYDTEPGGEGTIWMAMGF